MDFLSHFPLVVSIIFLGATPFVWRDLEPIEKFGWTIGSIIAAIGILSFVVGNIGFDYRVGIGIVAVVILALTAASTRYKLVAKNKQEKSTDNAPSSPLTVTDEALIARSIIPNLSNLTIHFGEKDATPQNPPASKKYFIVNSATNQAYWVTPDLLDLAKRGRIQCINHTGDKDVLNYFIASGVTVHYAYPKDWELTGAQRLEPVPSMSSLAIPEPGFRFYHARKELPDFRDWTRDAKHEIIIVAATLYFVSTDGLPAIREALKRNVTVKVFLLRPDSFYLKAVAEAQGFDQISPDVESTNTLKTFCNLKAELKGQAKTLLEINLCNLMPLHTTIARDPTYPEGTIRIEPFVHYGGTTARPSFEITKAREGEFENYWLGLQQVMEHSEEYSCP